MKDKIPGSINELIEILKSLVRPVIILSTWLFILVMTYEGRFDEIPALILGLGIVITGEYGVERAIKRLKGGKNGRD